MSLRRLFLAVSAATTFLSSSEGQESAPLPSPLMQNDVLERTIERFPSILEALAKRRAADGRALAAEGAFDLVFDAESSLYTTGFYDDSRYAQAVASRNLRAFGARVFGGYKISNGDLPIYEDIRFTNTGGEASVGLVFSLLRDRAIDDRRFNTADARLAVDQAGFELLLTKVGVQHQALGAYWRWVVSGRVLDVYRDLLRIAEARAQGLEEEVRRGARARIFLLENQQNITQRLRLVAEAERDFQAAANDLAFFLGVDWRELGAEDLPGETEDGMMDDLTTPPLETASARVANRPELAILRTSLERARTKLRAERNELLPKLDFQFELQHDFGGIAEGGVSRDATDTIIGLKFSVPFERREARGGVAAAKAEMDALGFRRQLTEERIQAEIQSILIELSAAGRIFDLAIQEVDQTAGMREAERRRFQEGASDFFLVNVREQTAADALIRYHLAELSARIARADYDAATADFGRLGIDPTTARTGEGWRGRTDYVSPPERGDFQDDILILTPPE